MNKKDAITWLAVHIEAAIGMRLSEIKDGEVMELLGLKEVPSTFVKKAAAKAAEELLKFKTKKATKPAK